MGASRRRLRTIQILGLTVSPRGIKSREHLAMAFGSADWQRFGLGGTVDWDIFISYASEDRDSVAMPLTELLRRRDLAVWIDDEQLDVGAPLERTLKEALAKASFGAVILSPDYIRKVWPQRELREFLSRETKEGSQVILPILHGIDRAALQGSFPNLEDKVCVRTSDGLDNVAKALANAVTRFRGPRLKSAEILACLAAALDLYALPSVNRLLKQIGQSEAAKVHPIDTVYLATDELKAAVICAQCIYAPIATALAANWLQRWWRGCSRSYMELLDDGWRIMLLLAAVQHVLVDAEACAEAFRKADEHFKVWCEKTRNEIYSRTHPVGRGAGGVRYEPDTKYYYELIKLQQDREEAYERRKKLLLTFRRERPPLTIMSQV
jgi:hypothetical protein